MALPLDSHDTALARYLHRQRRVDMDSLKGALEEVRRDRPDGGSLAAALVARGLLRPDEVAEAERLAVTAWGGGMSGSAEGLVGAPAPSTEHLPAYGGGSTSSDLPAVNASEVPRRPGGGRPTGRFASMPGPVQPALAESASGSGEYGGSGWRVGATVHGHRLIELRGAGAMGLVFVAEDLATRVRHAIKTSLATDVDTLARFRREGEAQARVDIHPNIVRVHASGEHAGRPYLVLELVDGQSLDERLRRGPLPWAEAAALGSQVASGLAHVHAHGVLHRDVKPANILIGPDGTPRLVDFGLARAEGTGRLTATGELIGTPAYMAPEQALGLHGKVGGWTDVYSLAAVLFAAVTGRDPFPGQTSVEVVDRLLSEPVPPLRRFRPDASPALEELLLRAMAKETPTRPTARAFAEQLAALARPAPTAGPELAGDRRRPTALIVVAGVAVLLAVAAVAVSRGRKGAGEEAVPQRGAGPTTHAPPPRAKPVVPARRGDAFPWKVGQTRRLQLTVVTTSTGNWGGQEFQGEQRRRFDLRCTARTVAPAAVVLDGVVDAAAVLLDGTARRSTLLPYKPVDLDTGRSPPDELHAALGAPLVLNLDPRTGRFDSIDGIDALKKALTSATSLLPFEAVELVGGRAVLADELGGLTHLLPEAGVEADASGWKVPRRWRYFEQFASGLEKVEVDVVARQRTGGGALLAWSGTLDLMAKRPPRGGGGFGGGGGGGRPGGDARPGGEGPGARVLCLLEGEATIGPDGPERATVSEQWRIAGNAFVIEMVLVVSPAEPPVPVPTAPDPPAQDPPGQGPR